jgi:hypothetical protein
MLPANGTSGDRDVAEFHDASGLEAAPAVLAEPIDIRSKSLAVLAFIAVIGFLYLAGAVFIPITITGLASYALTPLVDGLKRRLRLPKIVRAALRRSS